MKKLLSFLLLCFVWTISPVQAEGYTADNLPMPYLQDKRMHTCNPDGILAPATVAAIDSALFRLEAENGVQALCIVVHRVEGGDCYEFGMDIARKYKPGSKKRSTGLIFLLSTEDRCYQILTGDGIEGTLPDAICKRIENRKMLPHLRQSDWDNAMLETVKAACAYIQGDDTMKAEEEDDDETAAFIALGFITIGFSVMVLVIYLHERQKKRCPHCGKHKLQRMQSTQLSKKNGIITREVTYICRHCGHTLVRKETEHDDDYFSGGGPVIFMGGGQRGGFGGGFGGGSFGGGSFSGGGAGGRF